MLKRTPLKRKTFIKSHSEKWLKQEKINRKTGLGNKTKCEICGKIAKLDVHHIFKRSLFPELKNDPNNFLAICRNCHIKIHNDINFFEQIQNKYKDRINYLNKRISDEK